MENQEIQSAKSSKPPKRGVLLFTFGIILVLPAPLVIIHSIFFADCLGLGCFGPAVLVGLSLIPFVFGSVMISIGLFRMISSKKQALQNQKKFPMWLNITLFFALLALIWFFFPLLEFLRII